MSYAIKYVVVFLSQYGTGMDGFMAFHIWRGEGFFGADGLDQTDAIGTARMMMDNLLPYHRMYRLSSYASGGI